MAEGAAVCGEGEVSSWSVRKDGDSWWCGEGSGGGSGSVVERFCGDGAEGGGDSGDRGKVEEVCLGGIFRSSGQTIGWGDIAVSFVGRAGGYDCAGECGAGSALDSRCGDEGDREDGWRC